MLAISILSLICFAGSFAVVAQQEMINVRSLHVSYQYPDQSAVYLIRAMNSLSQPVIYGGTGSFYLGPLVNCSPCNIPNSFNSNNFSTGFLFRWADESYVYFTVTDSDSEPIIVSPRYTWKPRSITINGLTNVRGHVVIRDRFNNIVALSNDFVLHGSFTSIFGLFNTLPFGRLISFRQIDYQLDNLIN